MSARRLDPGERGEGPRPRKPMALWQVVRRHLTIVDLGTVVLALGSSIWFASDSVPRLIVVVLVLSSLAFAEVREMVLGQFRRIVMQRRLQEAFLECRICSRHRGLTPSAIGSAAICGGTVVRVWLPVGLSVDDLAARRHELAEICFVDEVHVERRPGRLNIVEVVLVHRTLGRRDRLGTPER